METSNDANAADVRRRLPLSIMSYNMHGYNQGFQTLRDLTLSMSPDIILLQEHWLTPVNLYKFDQDFSQYHTLAR